jgi:hypothetical protein
MSEIGDLQHVLELAREDESARRTGDPLSARAAGVDGSSGRVAAAVTGGRRRPGYRAGFLALVMAASGHRVRGFDVAEAQLDRQRRRHPHCG